MRILIACEFSGRVRQSFIDLGHDAVSCDLLPTEIPGPHHQGGVRPLLRERWDMVIAFPPCTYMAKSGACNFFRPGHEYRWAQMLAATQFFKECLTANAPMVAVENSLPHRYASAFLGKPDQIVSAAWFGDEGTKRACLWLKNLPPLMATLVNPDATDLVTKRYRSSGASKHRNALNRSRISWGLARAIAQQWGGLGT